MKQAAWYIFLCLLVFIVFPAVLLGQPLYAQRRDIGRLRLQSAGARPFIEKPARPDNFNNMDELNQYLAALREYYAVIGRPR